MKQLARDFFARPTLVVSRQLLGHRIIRLEDNQRRLSGLIIETEAYIGTEDQACHCRHGRTARNAVMWGPPGHAYVYFTYGMHWMLNITTEPEGSPAAILIRGLIPVEGLEAMRRRRLRRDEELTNGPAKLCQALAIDGSLNGYDISHAAARLYIEPALEIPDNLITTGPRVGLNNVPEPWLSKPWRFHVDQNQVRLLMEEEKL